MPCEQCKGQTRVLETRRRLVVDLMKQETHRRHKCVECGHRFASVETIIPGSLRRAA